MGVLNGKVAIVTGAGQGIGRGIAHAMALEGASIVIAELNTEGGAETAELVRQAGAAALSIGCDVSSRKQVEAAVKSTIDTFGAVDILVNNAQLVKSNLPLVSTSDADMDLALRSGVFGSFYFMQTCFPHMKGRGGKIINIGSGTGIQGVEGFGTYAVAKEGIRGLTRVAAREWGVHKINVNCVCPLAQTPAQQAWLEQFPDKAERVLSDIPLRRFGDPVRDIGSIFVFLASDGSNFITGQTIMADGGWYFAR